jgi:hypothetical protein
VSACASQSDNAFSQFGGCVLFHAPPQPGAELEKRSITVLSFTTAVSLCGLWVVLRFGL